MAISPDRQEKISLAETRSLFAYLSKDLVLFKEALRRLDSDAFHERQQAYRIYWEQLVIYYNRWQKLPSKDALQREIVAHMDELDLRDEDVENDILEILDIIPTIVDADIPEHRLRVRKILRIFLDFAAARAVAEQLTDGASITSVMTEASNRFQANRAIESGSSKRWFASMDIAMSEAKIVRFETGVPMLDEMFGGGLAGGEVTLHMGAVNSGKTTLAVQLGVSRAKLVDRYKREGKLPENTKVYFYVYEEARQVMASIISRASEVAYPSIKQYLETQDKDVLSSSEKGNYKDYERRRRSVRRQGKMDGELERLERAFKMLDRSMQFVSMSSEDPANIELSEQYVAGLVTHIEADALSNEVKPDLVIIDHASAMVERYMSSTAKKADERRHLLKQLAMHLRDKIAAPYVVPIWCLHQLGSEENKRPPGSVPDVASGSECRMMHEFFSFSVMSSRVTEEEKIGVIAMGKQRGMKGAKPRPFRIDGDMCRWVDARSTHMIHSDRVRRIEDLAPLGIAGVTKSGGANTKLQAFSPTRRTS